MRETEKCDAGSQPYEAEFTPNTRSITFRLNYGTPYLSGKTIWLTKGSLQSCGHFQAALLVHLQVSRSKLPALHRERFLSHLKLPNWAPYRQQPRWAASSKVGPFLLVPHCHTQVNNLPRSFSIYFSTSALFITPLMNWLRPCNIHVSYARETGSTSFDTPPSPR